MKSTVVDESLSSYKPMYCSREYQASTRLIQQYEKSTLKFCKLCQYTFISCKDSYHNLASSTNVKHNLLTFIPSGKSCAFIKSLVLSKWASASSSDFPENSGLKCNQFKYTICCPCWLGCGVGCAGCCGAYGTGWVGGGGGPGIFGACGPASAMVYLF